jgi:tripartite-type tricarboxylate transporter receptor subunit TctC
MKGEQVTASLLGGHVEVISDALSKVLPHLEAGKMRMLLITKGMPDFPAVRTITELGYKEDLFSAWAGLYAPAGIPSEVGKVLIPAIEKAINHQESIEKINKMGFNVEYRPPEALKKLSIEYYERASSVAKRLGVVKW